MISNFHIALAVIWSMMRKTDFATYDLRDSQASIRLDFPNMISERSAVTIFEFASTAINHRIHISHD